jgi:cytidyltransferase-like protein
MPQRTYMRILEQELSLLREEIKGRRVVLGVGAFDLYHAGHQQYLDWAEDVAGEGGIVVVMLRTDERVSAAKGKDRPIIEEEERQYIVDRTRPVDFTFLGTETPPDMKPQSMLQHYSNQMSLQLEMVGRARYINGESMRPKLRLL